MRDDFRAAVRGLTSTPIPIAAAILTLALAIGMNVGMVGLVARALLSPPEHVADPQNLFTVAFERGDGDQRARMLSTSYLTYTALRDNVTGFAGVAAWQRSETAAIIDGDQVRADLMYVSGSYFDVLGSKARMGRAVQAADDRAAADPVVVLSHGFWKSAFSGEPVLGRRLVLNGLAYSVIGVMPPRFSGHSAA